MHQNLYVEIYYISYVVAYAYIYAWLSHFFLIFSERTTGRHLNRLGLLAKGKDVVSDEALSAIKDLMSRGSMGANSIWRTLRRESNIHIKRYKMMIFIIFIND